MPMSAMYSSRDGTNSVLNPGHVSVYRTLQALRDLVSICLQKDPSKRPSAATLLQHRFFKQAKDASFLSTALLTAMLHSQQAHSSEDAAASRATSVPGCGSHGSVSAAAAGSSRKVHSEPLMARVKSALGTSLGSFLGSRGSRLIGGGGGGGGGLNARPRDGIWLQRQQPIPWLKARGGPTGVESTGGGVGGGGAAAGMLGGGMGAAGGSSSSSSSSRVNPLPAAAGSLSRSGSRGSNWMPTPAAEAARCSWLAK
jgi:hypothetical protein